MLKNVVMWHNFLSMNLHKNIQNNSINYVKGISTQKFAFIFITIYQLLHCIGFVYVCHTIWRMHINHNIADSKNRITIWHGKYGAMNYITM